MKQLKDKYVWAHRPDALPLPDAPSTGARRKKGVASKSKKHLWDLLRQEMKVLDKDFSHLKRSGIPKQHRVSSRAVSGDYYFALWAAEYIIKSCTRMEALVLELERRMDDDGWKHTRELCS